jgi:DNA recombination protein RmuC
LDPVALVLVIAALVVGVGLGWFLGSRGAVAARVEAQRREDDFKIAISDLAMAEERASQVPALREELAAIRDERDVARLQLTELRTKAEAFETRLIELREAKDVMAAQFGEVANTLLDKAQEKFLERASARFKEAEELAGVNLKSMLQPVSERLQRYEEGVAKVEAERRDAFGELKGQIEQMRIGTERVSTEAAKLVNSLRNAPKSRGRWGEQQLKNVLETCGLSEHTDFETEVNVAGEDGNRLRPDAIVRVPGGRALVIDAKVSLNAYQDAFGAVDETERQAGLALHAASMKAHINGLGNKAYWNQFEDAPDYVIMFVPGEHFLSAALEHDHTLWDFAFDKRVLLATPTNLIAIARTVSAVWRQEKLAKEARQIGELGKELYDRLAKALGDLRVVGSGLNTAVKNFNTFANSLETRALVSARKLRDLNIEPGAREIESIPPVELLASHAVIEAPEIEAPAQAAE